MSMRTHSGRAFFILMVAAGMVLTAYAPAQVSLTQLSEDTFTDSPSQHATEVEPGTYSWGSTIVTAFQVARIYGGGGADIGFATSKDGGVTWANGYLPGITIYEGGTWDAVSDAAVAYDALHGVWLISTLPLGSTARAVAVSRSSDGLNWSNPVLVTTTGMVDKNWIVCDNTPTSPYYGHCYSEWDRPDTSDLIQMSTSTDGGITWGPAMATAGNDKGIGGVPLVQPSGKVVVPIAGLSGMIAFSSTDGGNSWTKAVNLASKLMHSEAGSLRSDGLPSSAMDAKGKIYVAWSDCRYRRRCSSNDIVYSRSTDGITWSPVKRVPIDPATSTVDHFITGMGIALGTAGGKAQIALAYYYYPVSNCGSSCQLYVGFIQSSNGGKTWNTPLSLAGPMQVSWLPKTFSGYMVADYISVGYGNGKAYPVFAAALAPNGSLLQEAIYTTASGMNMPSAESEQLSSAGDHPVPNAHSDRGPMEYLDQEHRIPIKGHRPPKQD
jgi:hypothetical protein